jgi:hypothetical protein
LFLIASEIIDNLELENVKIIKLNREVVTEKTSKAMKIIPEIPKSTVQ